MIFLWLLKLRLWLGLDSDMCISLIICINSLCHRKVLTRIVTHTFVWVCVGHWPPLLTGNWSALVHALISREAGGILTENTLHTSACCIILKI